MQVTQTGEGRRRNEGVYNRVYTPTHTRTHTDTRTHGTRFTPSFEQGEEEVGPGGQQTGLERPPSPTARRPLLKITSFAIVEVSRARNGCKACDFWFPFPDLNVFLSRGFQKDSGMILFLFLTSKNKLFLPCSPIPIVF